MTGPRTFTAGDLVYSEQGEAFSYVARAAGGHIVLPVYGHDDEPEYIGDDPVRLNQVFAEPPAPKLDQATAEARQTLDELRTQINTARTELREVTRAHTEAMRTLEAHPDLRPVVEWLEGRITHVASVTRYGNAIAIQPIDEAVIPTGTDDRRNGDVRLLALYGGKTGPGKSGYGDDFRWQLNAYRDGSGDNTPCFLGTSEEHAKERLQAWLDTRLKRTSEYGTVGLARSAMRHGLRVPDELAERARAEDEAAEALRREREVQELAKAEQHAAALRARLAGTTAEIRAHLAGTTAEAAPPLVFSKHGG